jgi:hypothetical protein
MARKEGLRSPMQGAFPTTSVDGDKRDIHDQNPHPPFSEAKHDRGKNTLPNVFFEGEDDLGDVMGVVANKTRDILSSPMGGQRNSATGQRESPNSTLGIEQGRKK